MDSELVTVAEFRLSCDADLARSLLDSAGIECFLKDEVMGRLYGGASLIFGGIKLQVPSEDAEAARAILGSQDYLEGNASSPEET